MIEIKNHTRSINSITRKVSKGLLSNYGLKMVVDPKSTEIIKSLVSKFKQEIPNGYYVSVALGQDTKTGYYIVLASIYHIKKKYMKFSFIVEADSSLESLAERVNSIDSLYNFVPLSS